MTGGMLESKGIPGDKAAQAGVVGLFIVGTFFYTIHFLSVESERTHAGVPTRMRSPVSPCRVCSYLKPRARSVRSQLRTTFTSSTTPPART